MEISKSARLGYVDVAKGVAITLVVLGHALQSCYLTEEFWLFRWIYAFHMPLFMFVSGFVCWRAKEWKVCKKRGVQLLVPFFTAIVLGELIFHWQNLSFYGLGEKIIDTVLQPDLGLWFLWALFFINVIFVACRKLAYVISKCIGSGKHELAIEIAVVLCVGGLLNVIELVTVTKIMGYHWIAWYFLYFIAGVYLRLWFSRGMSSRQEMTLLWVSTVVFFVMVPFFRMHNEAPTFYKYINLGPLMIVAFRFAVGIAGCLMTVLLLKCLTERGFHMNVFAKLGGVTLGIYYFQFIVIHLMEDHVRMMPVWLQVVVIGVTALFVNWGLVEICKKFALTRVLCLGLPWHERKDRA